MLALLPLGVLSVAQTQDALVQVDETTLDGVAGATLRAVRSQIEVIKEAQVSARVLASVLRPGGNPGMDCVSRVTSMHRDLPHAAVIAYAPMSGLMTCSSNGEVVDLANEPIFQRLIAEPKPSIVYTPRGPISGLAVFGVGHPVFDTEGEQVGVVFISLPYLAVAPEEYADPVALWRPTYLATILGDGSLLVTSNPEVDPQSILPDGFGREELTAWSAKPSFQKDDIGRFILSVTSISQDLFLFSIWRRDDSSLWARASSATPYLLPALTWIAALIAAGFASSRLVVRHVRALSRSMSDYVKSRERVHVPDLLDAPTEIQSLHAAYDELIRTIEEEEADLQNLLVDKDQLLREVNHRSGNSLQIIASVMRMYRRESRDEELRSVLDGLINRVIALSSTHTSLYTLSGQRDVPVDEVLANVIRRLKDIHGVALGVATKHFQPVRMDAQMAMPLTLALAETITCHFAARNVSTEGVTVSLTEADNEVRMTVAGPIVPEFLPETTEGLASLPRRMLRQFAAQLRGTVTVRIEGNRSIVELVFPH